jgi:hypothetical protein
MIHDRADQSTMDRNHKTVINIKKSGARETEYFPRPLGKLEGPHENRFVLDDTFDKSCRLTKNPGKVLVPDFSKQTERRSDAIMKAGNVTIDIRGRTNNIYDGITKKTDLTL